MFNFQIDISADEEVSFQPSPFPGSVLFPPHDFFWFFCPENVSPGSTFRVFDYFHKRNVNF